MRLRHLGRPAHVGEPRPATGPHLSPLRQPRADRGWLQQLPVTKRARRKRSGRCTRSRAEAPGRPSSRGEPGPRRSVKGDGITEPENHGAARRGRHSLERAVLRAEQVRIASSWSRASTCYTTRWKCGSELRGRSALGVSRQQDESRIRHSGAGRRARRHRRAGRGRTLGLTATASTSVPA